MAALSACGGDAVFEPPAPPPADTPVAAAGERWSNPATWGGRLPQAGEDVVIPAGRTILIDLSPPPLRSVRIDGALVFDAERHIELTAGAVTLTRADSRFAAGSPSTPHPTRAVLTLSARHLPAPDADCGTQGLCVKAGTLAFFGAPRTAWTRLAATAARGATSITLTAAAGWRVGDRLVLASTDFDMSQAEEVTVTAVDGARVDITPPLRFEHFGSVQSFGDATIDTRGEVALLARNVTVRTDPAAPGRGGHVWIGAAARTQVSNVEFSGLGQSGVFARHPLHFHALRAGGAQSFVRGSVVVRSANRCISLVATDGVSIERNVCYDHVGNGFHIDGGAGVDNRFIGNLGLVTRAPAADRALLAAERPEYGGPATYFITHPRNTFRDNVAAGSASTGFWFAMPSAVTGAAAALAPDAYGAPSAEWRLDFSDNVAHSNRGAGVHQDNCLQADGTTAGCYWGPIREQAQALGVEPAPSDPRLRVEYGRITAYKNALGIGNRAFYMRYRDVRLADNGVGMVLACNNCEVSGGLIAGETANLGTPAAGERRGPRGHSLPDAAAREFDQRLVGFRFYDERVAIRDLTFAAFVHGALSDGTARAETAALSGNTTDAAGHSAAGIRFVDVPAETRIGMGVGGAQFAFTDVDGSVTGVPASVAAEAPSLSDASCTRRLSRGSHARAFHVCATAGDRFRFIDLWWYEGEFAGDNMPVGVTRIDAGRIGGAFVRTYENRLKLDRGTPMRLAFRDGVMTPGSTLRFSGLAPGDRFVIQVPYAQRPTEVVFGGAYFGPLRERQTALAPASGVATLAPNTWWFDASARLLHIDAQPHYLDYAFNDGFANLTVR